MEYRTPKTRSKSRPPEVPLTGKAESNPIFNYFKLCLKKADMHTCTHDMLPAWIQGSLLVKAHARVPFGWKNIAQPKATSVWPPTHSALTSENFAHQQAGDVSDRAGVTGGFAYLFLPFQYIIHHYRTTRQTFPSPQTSLTRRGTYPHLVRTQLLFSTQYSHKCKICPDLATVKQYSTAKEPKPSTPEPPRSGRYGCPAVDLRTKFLLVAKSTTAWKYMGPWSEEPLSRYRLLKYSLSLKLSLKPSSVEHYSNTAQPRKDARWRVDIRH